MDSVMGPVSQEPLRMTVSSAPVLIALTEAASLSEKSTLPWVSKGSEAAPPLCPALGQQVTSAVLGAPPSDFPQAVRKAAAIRTEHFLILLKIKSCSKSIQREKLSL